MYCATTVLVLAILVLAAIVEPYRVKIVKHSKSRDLSKKHNVNNFVPEYQDEDYYMPDFSDENGIAQDDKEKLNSDKKAEKIKKDDSIDDDDDYYEELAPTHYVPMTDDAAKDVQKQPIRNVMNNVLASDKTANDIYNDKPVHPHYLDEFADGQNDLDTTNDKHLLHREDYMSRESYDENQDGEEISDIKDEEDNGIFDDKDGLWHSNDNDIYGNDQKVDKNSKYYDPCDAVYCHYGRVCKSYPDGAATCECAEESFCSGHTKKVCGSDGIWYPSHCELHRQACVKGYHISVDHSAHICEAEEENRKYPSGHLGKSEDQEQDEESHEVHIDLSNVKDSGEDNDPDQYSSIEELPEGFETINSDALDIELEKKDDEDDKSDLSESKMKELKDKRKEKKKKKKQLKKDKKLKKKGKKSKKKHDDNPTDLPPVFNQDQNDLLEEKKKGTEDIILDKALHNQAFQSTNFRETDSTTLTPTPTHPSDDPTPHCDGTELKRLKDNLILYHCARIGETDCYNLGNKKQYLANIMFRYYDQSGNGKLDAQELRDVELEDQLGKLSQFCHLEDMLVFDDVDADHNITLKEFYRAFAVVTVSLKEKLKTMTNTVTVGNSLQLKCDVKGAIQLLWKRNGGMLSDVVSDEMKMFEDGSLYIGHIGLQHTGNYTCQDEANDEVIQTHLLKVQMPPKATVNPSTQFHTTGSTVTLTCRVNGVPRPEVIWEKNESPLPEDPFRYTLLYNNSTLEIRTAQYTTDTGAYKCVATNKAGTDQDIGTIFIENNKVPQYSNEIKEEFMVFHDAGYSVYEPGHCTIDHQVTGTFSDFKRVPLYGSTIPTLCNRDEACTWGNAVNVKNEFVYVSQPKLNRVVVINIRENHTPVELIQTDTTPVSIEYVSHLDQIWVVCWNGEALGGSAKTVVVIRDASKVVQHHTVHTQAIGDRFDLIRDLYLPPANDLGQIFTFGYTVHGTQQVLYKLDLVTLKYVSTIDLTTHECIPQSVSFLPIGGKVVIFCSSPDDHQGDPPKFSRLILDYITDQVLEYIDIGGEPHVSPDSRYMVTVDTDTNTIAVYSVNDDGKLSHVFEEYTSFGVADVTFFPSERGHSYDFFATSVDRNDLLYINLASGKIEMIEGLGEAIPQDEWLWSKENRVIVGGDMFGGYLMTPSKHSIVVIDGHLRHIQCEWEELKHANVITWIRPQNQL